MRTYTVRKVPGPNTDKEYQVYVNLLQDIGIDIADARRTPEPGTDNRWLHVWESKSLAERFARELRTRLRDESWEVHGFEVADDQSSADSRGPLAPLTVVSIATSEGTDFELEPASQERILAHFPNARLVGTLSYSDEVRQDYETIHGPIWDQVIIGLTGISEAAIASLGGIRIVEEEGGQVLYARLPTDCPK